MNPIQDPKKSGRLDSMTDRSPMERYRHAVSVRDGISSGLHLAGYLRHDKERYRLEFSP